MTNDDHLRLLLAQEELSQQQIASLQDLRAEIERQLRALPGGPRFYYGGSYAKQTMIRSSFDLDIVAYWPHDCGYTLRDIYYAVGNVLKRSWSAVNPKTVAWELPFQGGFHIDVVPGRALDGTYRYANLYRRDRDSTLQTSVKVHIDTVRNSGRRDVIRLMKLWRVRRGVPFKKSLALELMIVDGCYGVRTDQLERQMIAALRYLRDNIARVRIVDPANSNNVLSDEISDWERSQIRAFADAALRAQSWSQVLT
jgi:hypothetical protein